MTSLAEHMEERRREAYRVAEEMFQQNPDWVDFFREMLGIGGVVPRLFPNSAAMRSFQQSQEYRDIQRMLKHLRDRRPPVQAEEEEAKEPVRVITVRLPAALHEALRQEARDRSTSMNTLCISKLLQVIDEAILPAQRRRKKERPPEDSAIDNGELEG